jgi:hypothetical protein
MVEQSPAANTGDPQAGHGRRFSAGAIAALVGVGLLIAFMIQNTEVVTVQFLFWSRPPSGKSAVQEPHTEDRAASPARTL